MRTSKHKRQAPGVLLSIIMSGGTNLAHALFLRTDPCLGLHGPHGHVYPLEDNDPGRARTEMGVGTQIPFPRNSESGRPNQWVPSWDKMGTLEVRVAFWGN